MTTNGGTISTNSNTVALTTNNEQVEIKSHSRTSSTTSSLRNRMGTNTNPTPTATTSARYPAVKSTNANRQIEQIGKYRLLKTIGKGNFAKVKLARHISTHKEVAIKIIDKTQLNPTSLLKLFREVKIMKLIGDHPNIVKLFQVIETEKTLYLVMEYISGGEVFEYLVTNGRLKEKEARSKFRQIVSAVQYLHQKNIIHRDLKAENLLLDKDMNIKLVDYGFSNEFVPGNKLETYCGSPPYAAPELFQGRKYDGPEVDVWSLGVILYTLVSGSLPFDGSTLRELRERVIRGKYRIPFYMSTDCENLLRKFLVLNPTKRFTLEQIMKDKWMNVGHEDNELLPFIEPSTDVKDQKRIESLMTLGYNLADIEQSISKRKYDDIHATYLLLDGSNKLPTNSKSSEGSLSPRSGSTGTANALTQPTKHSSVHRSSSSSSKRRSSSSGETLKTFTPSKTAQNKVIDDTKKISSKQAINEKTPAIITASNFKRQNTIDSALMKEKNSSHSTNTIIARPMSAIPKTEKPVEKARTSLKYELSNATCLTTPKRPTTLYEDANHKAAPTEKQTKDNAIAVNLNPAANSFVRPSLAFPRNVPSRSTFHSGQTRNVSRTSSTMGTPSGESPYSGGKGNFLQRLTTRFSKRFRLSNSKTNNNNNNTSNN